jgi:hypothetical protein
MFKLAPVWRNASPLMLIAAVAAIAEPIAGLLRTLPPWARPAIKIGTLALQLAVVFVLLSSRTYIVSLAPQSGQWVSITNQVLYICLVCAAAGQLVAMMVQGWKTYRAIERPSARGVTRPA